MFAGLQNLLKDGNAQLSRRSTRASAEEEPRPFEKQLAADAKDVINKSLTGMQAELRQIVDEVVHQSSEHWQRQVHLRDETHKAELMRAIQEGEEASRQLDETVTMYNSVVQNLNAQLAEAHEGAEAAKRVAEAKAAVAHQQSVTAEVALEENSSNYKAMLQELNKQLMASQTALHDAELRAQQKRQTLMQTVEKQHKEVVELMQKVKQTQEALAISQQRDRKLTTLSEALLAKQAELTQQLGRANAPKGSGVAAAHETTSGADVLDLGPDVAHAAALAPAADLASHAPAPQLSAAVAGADVSDLGPAARDAAAPAPSADLASRAPTPPLSAAVAGADVSDLGPAVSHDAAAPAPATAGAALESAIKSVSAPMPVLAPAPAGSPLFAPVSAAPPPPPPSPSPPSAIEAEAAPVRGEEGQTAEAAHTDSYAVQRPKATSPAKAKSPARKLVQSPAKNVQAGQAQAEGGVQEEGQAAAQEQ